MAPLEQAVAAIVCTFQEYSGPCWRQVKLCQAELKELLEKELPTWTPVSTWGESPWEALLGCCKETPGDEL